MEQECQFSNPQDSRGSSWGFVLAFLAGGLVVSYVLLRTPPAQVLAQAAPPLFQGWGKPDLAIVVSGEMHGYLQPCGCSDPQKGGLARRYNFLQSLKDKGWPILAVDLGDIAQTSGSLARLKYITSMRALQLMGYSAIGIGKRELLMPLHDALGEFSVDHEKPRPVALNLTNTAKKNDVFFELNARQFEIVNAKPKVGIIGLVGPTIASEVNQALPERLKKDIKFGNNGHMIQPALAQLANNNVEFAVMLYQGSEKEALACADYCAKVVKQQKGLPPVRLILCLADNESPPGITVQSPNAPDTHVVSIGHKGIYVGVVGLFGNRARGYEVKYQLVSIGPEYQTKAGKEKINPVNVLMEDYAKKVKEGTFLAKTSRGMHPMQVQFNGARYIGSERCGDCHEHAYNVWKKSGHSHAYDTLVHKAKNPSLRQFDPECVACHTVGYQYDTGYFDAQNKPKLNAKLLGVGCESCHGPGSAHENNPNNKAIHKAMNPYAEKWMPAGIRRFQQMDFSCQKCHDIENDVNWGKVDFIKGKWLKIEHADPKKKQNGVASPAGAGRRPSAGIDLPDEKALRKE